MGELVPLSRTEMYLAVLAGEDHKTPEPFTRSEMYLAKIMEQAGDLVSATVEAKKAAEAAIAAAEAADAAHGASGAALLDITIPTDGWESENGAQSLRLPVSSCTAAALAVLSLDAASLSTAAEARLCSRIESLDGAIRITASSVPTFPLTGSLLLLKKEESGGEGYTLPVASKDTLGGVKIGPGITGSEDGTISAEAILSEKEKATDEEVAEALDEVFNRAKAR